MKLVRARVQNFKSIRDTKTFPLDEKLTSIVGRNGSGKTALLRGLALEAENYPHRTIHAARFQSAQMPPASIVTLSVRFSPEECQQVMRDHVQYALPDDPSVIGGESLHQEIRENGVIATGTWFNRSLDRSALEFDNRPLSPLATIVYQAADHGLPFLGHEMVGRQGERGTLARELLATVPANIYLAHAERSNPTSTPITGATRLAPDSSNLPDVLNALVASDRVRYQDFVGVVKRVLPEIQDVRATSGSMANILVRPHGAPAGREDLEIPLRECGTGVGQVLAMAYMAVALAPQVILIDEPQSHLHPSALRRLLDEFSRTEHQLILSSHSTIPLNRPDSAIIAVRLNDGETIVQPLAVRDVTAVKLLLAELGVGIGEVYGAERVLWVEGLTEELCFVPLINRIDSRILSETIIRHVRATGDFDRRGDKALVIDIYSRLSSAAGFLPQSARFVFDPENRPEQELHDQVANSNGALFWLRRRMFENYLLSPKAVADVLNQLGAADMTEEQIREIMRTSPASAKCERQIQGEAFAPAWLNSVHGKKVLEFTFEQATERRLAYREYEHGPLLTEAMLVASDSDLLDLGQWLARDVLSAGSGGTAEIP